MQKFFFYSIIISKKRNPNFSFFLFSISNRDRILDALSRIDPSNDHNTYTQLIKNLSLPVNRLEKYASLFKEYLYNLEVKF